MNKINIINACSDLGVHIDGSNLAPPLISSKLNKKDIDIIYTINKENVIKEKKKDNHRKNFNAINEFSKKLYNKAEEILNQDNFLITIGGDHSIAIGSALASANNYKNLGIIWIDAHPDFNTFETTITGNIHGLPLAAICGYKNHDLTSFLTNNYINPKNAVVVGARSIDPLEYENLKDAGVTIFTTNDIKQEGTLNIMNKAFNIALNGTNGLHISYDIDVIDPTVAPGVSVDEENGISEVEAYQIMDYLCSNINSIKSLDLVEYNPLLDKDNVTLEIAIKLLNKFIETKKNN